VINWVLTTSLLLVTVQLLSWVFATQERIKNRRKKEIRNGNARGDGITRRNCRMKIEFREAPTVKQPKTLQLVPRSLHCFPNPLLILDLSTPALSRSFRKLRQISSFLALYPERGTVNPYVVGWIPSKIRELKFPWI